MLVPNETSARTRQNRQLCVKINVLLKQCQFKFIQKFERYLAVMIKNVKKKKKKEMKCNEVEKYVVSNMGHSENL